MLSEVTLSRTMAAAFVAVFSSFARSFFAFSVLCRLSLYLVFDGLFLVVVCECRCGFEKSLGGWEDVVEVRFCFGCGFFGGFVFRSFLG